MTPTYQELLIKGLTKLGWVRDYTDRSKYVAFCRPDKDKKIFVGSRKKIFVGSRGALRVGECASRSYSIGDPSDQTLKYKAVLEAATQETLLLKP